MILVIFELRFTVLSPFYGANFNICVLFQYQILYFINLQSPSINRDRTQCIPIAVRSVTAFRCFIMFCTGQVYPYTSGLFNWYCGKHEIVLLLVKQCWTIRVNQWCYDNSLINITKWYVHFMARNYMYMIDSRIKSIRDTQRSGRDTTWSYPTLWWCAKPISQIEKDMQNS